MAILLRFVSSPKLQSAKIITISLLYQQAPKYVFRMTGSPKYSVIIPSRNGCRYLSYAIRSVLDQQFEDFELIVSDNHSSDGTWGFLSSLSDPRLRSVQPLEPLSMTRHFEFAIGQAKGEWITVLGDDDALQPYFFDLAEKLTLASSNPVISSPRAYYNWPGCEVLYSETVVVYSASRKTSARNSLARLLKLLLFPGRYLEEPQFYTGTLFRNEMFKDIKVRHHGVVFKSSCPDADSVALIFQHTSDFTFSHIPLAWVGSSPKSTGFAHSGTKENSIDVQEDFSALVIKDKIFSDPRFPFSLYINNLHGYFMVAFFQVHDEPGLGWGRALKFKPTLYLLFAKLFRDYNASTDPGIREAYEKTFATNGLNLSILGMTSLLLSLLFALTGGLGNTLSRVKRVVFRMFTEGRLRASPFEKVDRPGRCVFSSASRSEFPTILHASAQSKILYDKRLS